jgi:hypothetical protein
MQQFHGVAQDKYGNVQAGVSVTIRVQSTGVVATIYSDNGITLLANPLTTNVNGEYSFYAADGIYTASLPGAILREIALGSQFTLPSYVIKSATETVSNSTVLQDDNELTFAVSANETWTWQACIGVTSPAAAGLKVGVDTPNYSFLLCRAQLIDESTDTLLLDENFSASAVEYAGGGVALADDSLMIWGHIVLSNFSGSITFQWAQETADVGNTSFNQYSALMAWKVS